MALTVNTQSQAAGIINRSVGQVATDAGAAADTAITLGFVPRRFVWMDRTNRIMLEWLEGMAANSALRTVAAGTRTLDVASGITISAPSSGALTATIKAADIPASAVFSWIAEG